VIPVITPSWPFIDDAAALWINKAQKIFSENQLLEISFDSSLSFGERIISKVASRLPLASKLLEDYRRLAAQIREKNPLDCLTIWNNIRQGSHGMLADPADLYLTLLKRRPRVLEYWRGLGGAGIYPWIMHGLRKSTPGWEKLAAFINQEADNGNKFALFGRALMKSEKDDASSRNKAIADLDRALQIDPSFFEALIERGHIAYFERRYEDAVLDFSRCLDIRQDNSKFPRSRIEAELAESHLKMFDGKGALLALAKAITEDPSDLAPYRIRARALYLEGDYQAALSDARRVTKLGPEGDASSLLPSQILAAMGHINEAAKELEASSAAEHAESHANIAEAYLPIDPEKTIALLNANPAGTSAAVRSLLMRLARILSGEQTGIPSKKSGSEGSERIDHRRWNFFETVAMLRAKERAGRVSKETIDLAYEAIRSAADPTEFSFIQRSRANLEATPAMQPPSP
jgi:tetratricopeptide (TPR) repeat protein